MVLYDVKEDKYIYVTTAGTENYLQKVSDTQYTVKNWSGSVASKNTIFYL